MNARNSLTTISRGVEVIASSLVELLFPRKCAGCGKIEKGARGFWCDECLDGIGRIRSPICPCCGRPFLDSPQSSDHLCGECIAGGFNFDGARSAVLHEGIIRERIHQLKFGGRLERVPPLAALIACTYKKWGVSCPDLIIPVPLHMRRLRERGFNQSGLLAGELAGSLGLPVSYSLLVRKTWTEPQTRLNRSERLKNVRGAFDVPRPEGVKGRRILLIDDVFTTGETLSECSRTLKKKGAREVLALTVTRAFPD